MHDTMQMTAEENKNHPVNDAYIGNEAEQSPHSAPKNCTRPWKQNATSHHKTLQ